MARLQHIAVTSGTTPFIRVLRMLDGVVTVDAAFPGAASPVALRKAEFSPDGAYLIAAATAQLTTCFRLWKLGSDGENFVEVALPAQAAARTINDVRWVTNTLILFACNTTGLWQGVLNRATDVITWTQINTTLYTNIAVHPNTTIILASRNNLVNPFTRSGDTVAAATGTFTTPSVAWAQAEFDKDGQVLLLTLSSPTSTSGDVRRYADTHQYITTSILAGTTDPQLGMKYVRASKRWGMFYVASIAAPFLRFWRTVTFVANTSYKYSGITPDVYPAFPAAFNAVEEAGEEAGRSLVLCAINSATQTTGRVRGFYYEPGNNTLTEDTSIAALFNDWNAVPNHVVAGPTRDLVVAGQNIYPNALSRIVGGTQNLSQLKMLLVNSTPTFNAAHTTLAQVVGANEVYGGSWPQGGITLPAATAVIAGTGAALVCDIPPTDMTAAGSIVFRSAVIYDNSNTDKTPIMFIRYAADKSAQQYDRMIFDSVANRLSTFEVA